MSTKSYMTALIAIAAIVVPAFGGAEADPKEVAAKEGSTAAAPVGSRHDGAGAMKDDEIRDMVSAILMVRVSRSLDLTDEQTVILVKHMQEMREQLSKAYSDRDEIVKSLKTLVDKDGATDDEINAKLQELISTDEKRQQVKKDAFEKISSGLTTKQKAKLFITLQEFEGQMRRMVMRAKEMGEDALKDKFHDWNRGDALDRAMDRPTAKQFMKGRHPDAPSVDGEAPKAPEAKTP